MFSVLLVSFASRALIPVLPAATAPCATALRAVVLVWSATTHPSQASQPAQTQPADLPELQRHTDPLIDKAMKYLVAGQQADGGW